MRITDRLLSWVRGARASLLRGQPRGDSDGSVASVGAPVERRHRDDSGLPGVQGAVGVEAGSSVGRIIDGTFANGAGTRRYRVYVPGGHEAEARSLVVMLHGCKQGPEDFAAGTGMNAAADAYGCIVVYPAQATVANRYRCWTWFRSAHQMRDRGEPSLIAGITREVVAAYGVDRRRVYVAGLSAGAAMAVILGETYPDLYAAIGAHSGLPYASARDVLSAFSAMRRGAAPPKSGAATRTRNEASGPCAVPTIVFHGDSDAEVHPRNADLMTSMWLARQAAMGAPLRAITRDGRMLAGRTYTVDAYEDHDGRSIYERWTIHGAGHAWSGGSASGSYTDPLGPDATREMLRFFRQHTAA